MQQAFYSILPSVLFSSHKLKIPSVCTYAMITKVDNVEEKTVDPNLFKYVFGVCGIISKHDTLTKIC